MEEEVPCFTLHSGFLLQQTTTGCSDLVMTSKPKSSSPGLTLQLPAGQQWETHLGNRVQVPGSFGFRSDRRGISFFKKCIFSIYCSGLAHFCAISQSYKSYQLREKVWPVFLSVKNFFPHNLRNQKCHFNSRRAKEKFSAFYRKQHRTKLFCCSGKFVSYSKQDCKWLLIWVFNSCHVKTSCTPEKQYKFLAEGSVDAARMWEFGWLVGFFFSF